MVEAANLIGSKQVQGRCSMVGNLCNASPIGDLAPVLLGLGLALAEAGIACEVVPGVTTAVAAAADAASGTAPVPSV